MERKGARIKMVFFLLYGHLVIRLPYAVFVFLNLAQYVPPNFGPTESLYCYVASAVAGCLFGAVPVLGIFGGLASAWAVFGWWGVLMMAPLAALECYRWYLRIKMADAVDAARLSE
jgi:hypothetical protein